MYLCVYVCYVILLIYSVPRVLFDGWSRTDYDKLFSDESAIEDCASVLLKFINVSDEKSCGIFVCCLHHC